MHKAIIPYNNLKLLEDSVIIYRVTRALLNPKGPETGTQRIIRGGWASNEAEYCELSLRVGKEPLWHKGLFGLRLTMSL
jgi:hypothetical protein